MFNVSKIQGSLHGLVGFRQPINPTYSILDYDNLESRSGRYITDQSALKVEYIKENLDYKDATPTQFNQFLSDKQDAAIMAIMDQVFNTPDFIDRQVLYQHANNKTEVETLPDGFVGYKIRTALDKAWSFEVTRMILEFQGTGEVEILLWNSNKKEVVESQTVTITTDLQEVSLGWRIDNTDVAYKGEYYIGYLTQGLTVTPFKREYENANVISVITGMCWEQIEVVGHASTDLFDLTEVDGSSINSGLNPDITVFNDYTDTIIQNQNLFARAISMQMQIDFLSEIMSSRRFNLEQRNSEDMLTTIIIELEGLDGDGDIKRTGLKKKLLGEINHIRKEIKRLQGGYFSNGFILNTQT